MLATCAYASSFHHTVDKVEALKKYKFSLAFENSNEEDYVTEKFFQSLVAGVLIRPLAHLVIISLEFNPLVFLLSQR